MINLFKVFVTTDVDEPLLETLHSGYITQGEKVNDFELAFSNYIGNPFAVAVNSGTSALTLALRVAGVGYGDEVVTTAMTCTATNLPILSLGAIPVFADVDPITGLIDPKDVAKKITNKTKAIMCCDWGGMPCDLDELLEIAHKNGVKLIEDAAHALGAEYGSVPVGDIADFTCFSLQAIKHITTGDGGFLMCKNEDDYHEARTLRWFGIDRDAPATDTRIDQDILNWGYKFHMNDLNATIGIEQLKYLNEIVLSHIANAQYYADKLDSTFIIPHGVARTGSSWLFTVLLPSRLLRDKFKDYMLKKDIQVSQVHKRNDEYTVFRPFKTDLPNTTSFANRMICIPVHWALTKQEVDYIVDSANKFVKEHRQWY